MKIPAFFYGDVGPVMSAGRKKAKALAKGDDFDAVVGSEMLDTDTTPGLISLEYGGPLEGHHFHVYALDHALGDLAYGDKISDELHIQFVLRQLREPWGVLGVLGQHAIASNRDALIRPLLKAAVRFWPEFSALGERFIKGFEQAEALRALPTGITFALGKVGYSGHDPFPLPATGPEEWLRIHVPDLFEGAP